MQHNNLADLYQKVFEIDLYKISAKINLSNSSVPIQIYLSKSTTVDDNMIVVVGSCYFKLWILRVKRR